MTAEPDWPEIQAIFNTAIELPPGERASFLDACCADRPAVRAEAIAESMAMIDINTKVDLGVSLFDLGVVEAQAGRMSAACDAYRRSFALTDGLLRSETLPPSLERRL